MPGDVTWRKQEPENRSDRFVSTLERHQNSDENEEPLLFLIHLDVNFVLGSYHVCTVLYRTLC
jgi:hypothetical protein